MAASGLNSERALSVSVFIVRAFVELREVVTHHKEHGRIACSSSSVDWGRTDAQIAEVVAAVRQH